MATSTWTNTTSPQDLLKLIEQERFEDRRRCLLLCCVWTKLASKLVPDLRARTRLEEILAVYPRWSDAPEWAVSQRPPFSWWNDTPDRTVTMAFLDEILRLVDDSTTDSLWPNHCRGQFADAIRDLFWRPWSALPTTISRGQGLMMDAQGNLRPVEQGGVLFGYLLHTTADNRYTTVMRTLYDGASKPVWGEEVTLPGRLVEPKPTWLHWNDSTIPRLAAAIYEKNRWGDVPILGDALEDAGCDVPEYLEHARRPQHFRGCWLVDWVRKMAFS